MRFFLQAVPLVVLLLFVFSLTIGFFDVGPAGALTVLDWKRVSVRLLLGTWLLEAFGLVALFLLIEGRHRPWWLDGLMAGWLAWIFRGPLLVVTIVVAAGLPQAPWFRLAVGWWALYSVCGLVLAILARRLSAGAPSTPARPLPVEAEHVEPSPPASESFPPPVPDEAPDLPPEPEDLNDEEAEAEEPSKSPALVEDR